MKRQLNTNTLQDVLKQSLWLNSLKEDCLNQKVFPALRNDLIDFYHKGGRLFQFYKNDFKTHLKYAEQTLRKRMSEFQS